MRISLINYTSWPLLDVRLGTFIAHLRSEGHDVHLIDLAISSQRERAPPLVIKQLQENPSDVIALSAGMYPREVYQLISQIRLALGDTPILLGGMGPAMSLKPYLQGEEMSVRKNLWSFAGEDFQQVTALLRDIERGNSRQGGHIKTGVVDVVNHPIPDYRLFDLPTYFKTSLIISGFVPLYASLGCPYSCSFCNDMLRPYQHKAPEQVLEEVRVQESRHRKDGMRTLNFEDRCFGLMRKPFVGMMSLFKDEGISERLPWACHTRPEVVTREWAARAADGGCVLVGIGLESGSEKVRKNILNKGFTNTQLKAAVRNLNEAGIQCYLYLMTGIPGTTFWTDLASLRFALRQKPLKVNLVRYHPSAGTTLGDKQLAGARNVRSSSPPLSCLRMPLLNALRAPYHLSRGLKDHGFRYPLTMLRYLLNADGERALPLTHPFVLHNLFRRTTIDLWLERRQELLARSTIRGGDGSED